MAPRKYLWLHGFEVAQHSTQVYRWGQTDWPHNPPLSLGVWVVLGKWFHFLELQFPLCKMGLIIAPTS